MKNPAPASPSTRNPEAPMNIVQMLILIASLSLAWNCGKIVSESYGIIGGIASFSLLLLLFYAHRFLMNWLETAGPIWPACPDCKSVSYKPQRSVTLNNKDGILYMCENGHSFLFYEHRLLKIDHDVAKPFAVRRRLSARWIQDDGTPFDIGDLPLNNSESSDS